MIKKKKNPKANLRKRLRSLKTNWPFTKLGIVLAGEEHPAARLVELAKKAEEKNFGFCFFSDHFHPWNFSQGHSSHLWSVLGAVAAQTKKLGLVSAVTCPIFRIHPSTLAQAASTVYNLSEGRFVLGLGTGEFLNEHIIGVEWPSHSERLARLEESLDFVRRLLDGKELSLKGKFFELDRAQLFDSAPELPIYLACSGPKTAKLASIRADGMICLGPRPELASIFSKSSSGPKVTQLSVCWAPSIKEAQETAHKHFPEVCLDGTLFTQLATPRDFEEATRDVRPDEIPYSIICGPDANPYLEAVEECFRAGFDAVALHQIGPRQEDFMSFFQTQLLPQFS